MDISSPPTHFYTTPFFLSFSKRVFSNSPSDHLAKVAFEYLVQNLITVQLPKRYYVAIKLQGRFLDKPLRDVTPHLEIPLTQWNKPDSLFPEKLSMILEACYVETYRMSEVKALRNALFAPTSQHFTTLVERLFQQQEGLQVYKETLLNLANEAKVVPTVLSNPAPLSTLLPTTKIWTPIITPAGPHKGLLHVLSLTALDKTKKPISLPAVSLLQFPAHYQSKQELEHPIPLVADVVSLQETLTSAGISYPSFEPTSKPTPNEHLPQRALLLLPEGNTPSSSALQAFLTDTGSAPKAWRLVSTWAEERNLVLLVTRQEYQRLYKKVSNRVPGSYYSKEDLQGILPLVLDTSKAITRSITYGAARSK